MIGLTYIRRKSNLSLAELSAVLGVSRQAISSWENGRKQIPPKRKAEMAEFFGIDEKFFGEITDVEQKELEALAMSPSSVKEGNPAPEKSSAPAAARTGKKPLPGRFGIIEKSLNSSDEEVKPLLLAEVNGVLEAALRGLFGKNAEEIPGEETLVKAYSEWIGELSDIIRKHWNKVLGIEEAEETAKTIETAETVEADEMFDRNDVGDWYLTLIREA
ncbi:MAG: helix-turn-helix transcriptional regulator [Lachnospiraceae bacterium]|nr:helix-turn-helix transcriptional regulator [Lachnospiraceae bacterium]